MAHICMIIMLLYVLPSLCVSRRTYRFLVVNIFKNYMKEKIASKRKESERKN